MASQNPTNKSDPSAICVVGGGPAGLAAALAIAHRGAAVTVVAPALESDLTPSTLPRDTRTTAVLGDGITFLDNVGVWKVLRPVSAALTGIRIVDDRGGLLSAPEVLFDARELERTEFGFNIPNDPLRAALLAAAAAHPAVTLAATAGVVEVIADGDAVILKTAENSVHHARLVVAADGRRSLARAVAGIAERAWDYPQVAIATSFGHARTHGGISTELHRRAGPLTTVPLPDDGRGPRSSLVWIETPEESHRLMALDDAAFIATLETHLKGLLGRVSHVEKRATFPIRGLMATSLARKRIVLAGEAAHVVPPIGAQGLNLGFRDAAAVADAVAEHGARDPGAAEVLAAYERSRRPDLVSREIGIDMLNRALLLDFLPVQAMRGLGLHALANSPMLRRAAMRMGLAAPGQASSLMRSHAVQSGPAPKDARLANQVRDGR